jgi:hypothetical protein
MKKAPLVIFCQFCALSFAQTQSITIPAGTEISIRTTSAINSKKADTTTEYQVSMDDPVTVNGVVVVPANAKAWLRAAEINNPKFAGRASMSMVVVAVTATTGERIEVITGKVDSQAGSHAKRTLVGAGVGAGTGAAIGSVGGGVGAGIGAAAGAATGAAIGKITGNREGVTVPSETRFTYTLTQPVTIVFQSPDLLTRETPARPQATSGTRPSSSEMPVPPRAASDNPLPPQETPPSPSAIKIGQTTDEVVAQRGKPDTVFKSGSAEIYRYKEVRVVFVDGKVTEVY